MNWIEIFINYNLPFYEQIYLYAISNYRNEHKSKSEMFSSKNRLRNQEIIIILSSLNLNMR